MEIHTHLEDPNMGQVNLNWKMSKAEAALKKLMKLLMCSEAQKLASDDVRMLKKLSKLEVVQEKAPLRRGEVVVHVNTKDYRRLEEEIRKEREVISSILSKVKQDVDYPTLLEWTAKLSVVTNACGTISEGVGFCSYTLKEGLKKGITHAFDKFMLPKLDEVEEKQAVAKRLDALKMMLQQLDGLKLVLSDMERKVDNDLVGKKTEDEGKSVGAGRGKGGKNDEEKTNGGNGVDNGTNGGKSLLDTLIEHGAP